MDERAAPNPYTILIQARGLISEPSKWHKGTDYRDWYGEICGHEDAITFCARGAINYLTTPIGEIRRTLTFILLRHQPVKISLSGYNDLETTTHKDILALFDRAIASTLE